MAIKSIIDGCYEKIDSFLGITHIGKSPHFNHKSSYQYLSENPKTEIDFEVLIFDLYKQINNNMKDSSTGYDKLPSRENWRFNKQLNIDNTNTSPETTLEKILIQSSDDNLINQVPTSSGLIGPTQDKKRNLDMVLRCSDSEYEFIELKVDSNTPVYAAMEILIYGLLFLFSVENKKQFEYDDKVIINAAVIHLIALAPYKYYSYDINWLEDELNKGLSNFFNKNKFNMKMDFCFQTFPEEFDWPSDDDAMIAFNNRKILYP
ncbi:MAG: hypothetical protein RLT87_07390 [Gammaproteobacteria bacterium]